MSVQEALRRIEAILESDDDSSDEEERVFTDLVDRNWRLILGLMETNESDDDDETVVDGLEGDIIADDDITVDLTGEWS